MGTSGWCCSLEGVIFKWGDIKASDFTTRESYWHEHKRLIEKTNPTVVVIESYRLHGHKAKQQTGSSLETPMLIGYMQMVCYELGIPVVLQDPSTKSRHSDEVLTKIGFLEKKGTKYYYKGESTNLHMRDSMRHNLYFYKYGRKK